MTAPMWTLGVNSVRGAAHERLGMPNQDAAQHWLSPDGSVAAVAVADGHGAARHFRSAAGAQLATTLAMQTIAARVEMLRGPAMTVDAVRAQLLVPLVAAWRSAVLADATTQPFLPAEAPWLDPQDERAVALDQLATAPLLAYGTTLLVAVATPDQLLLLQIGDGAILCVDDAGRVAEAFPTARARIGNQTDSLAMHDAETVAHVHALPPAALVLLASDGYVNAFRSTADFHQIGPDYLRLFAQRADEVREYVPTFLAEASAKGSGDDVTLGWIMRGAPIADRTRLATEAPAVMRHSPAQHAAIPEPASRRRPVALVLSVVALLAMVGWWWLQPRCCAAPGTPAGRPATTTVPVLRDSTASATPPVAGRPRDSIAAPAAQGPVPKRGTAPSPTPARAPRDSARRPPPKGGR